MNAPKNATGRISECFKGLGSADRKLVEDRARELSVINGRAPNDFNEGDLRQARAELTGRETPGGLDEETIQVSGSRNPVPGTPGHRAETKPAPDEQTVAEHLVEDGVAEADHDKMLRASRSQDKNNL